MELAEIEDAADQDDEADEVGDEDAAQEARRDEAHDRLATRTSARAGRALAACDRRRRADGRAGSPAALPCASVRRRPRAVAMRAAAIRRRARRLRQLRRRLRSPIAREPFSPANRSTAYCSDRSVSSAIVPPRLKLP